MDPAPIVRLADPSDAVELAGLLHDFNTEFDTPSPGPAVLADRLATLLGGDHDHWVKRWRIEVQKTRVPWWGLTGNGEQVDLVLAVPDVRRLNEAAAIHDAGAHTVGVVQRDRLQILDRQAACYRRGAGDPQRESEHVIAGRGDRAAVGQAGRTDVPLIEGHIGEHLRAVAVGRQLQAMRIVGATSHAHRGVRGKLLWHTLIGYGVAHAAPAGSLELAGAGTTGAAASGGGPDRPGAHTATINADTALIIASTKAPVAQP